MYSILIPITGNDGKTTTVSAPATTLPSDGVITALYDAIADVILGVEQKSILQQSTDKDVGSLSLPTSGAAQRSAKWLVRYTDGAGDLHRMEIGTANHALTVPPSDFLDLTAGEGLALKDALEDLTLNGGAITVLTVQAIGRSI